MAGAVNVSVVTLSGLILNVTGVDGDSSFSLLGCVIDLVVSEELDLIVTECEDLGDSSGKSGLTMVNVSNSTNVDMGFSTLKGFLCHVNSLLNIIVSYYWIAWTQAFPEWISALPQSGSAPWSTARVPASGSGARWNNRTCLRAEQML